MERHLKQILLRSHEEEEEKKLIFSFGSNQIKKNERKN